MFDFSNVFSGLDNINNGATYWIMQSQENRKKVFKRLKEGILKGEDPNNIIDDILEKENISKNDFTSFDLKKLISDTENFYNQLHS